MSIRILIGALVGALFLAPCPAPACSLCGMLLNQATLRQETEDARLILFGTMTGSRLNGADGTGTTDFKIDRVIKHDPWLAGRNTIELRRYIPVLDPKDPPRYVVFCNIKDGQLDPYRGRPVKSAAVLAYLEGAMALRGKDKTTSLLYFFRHLDSEDPDVAADAFLEFARSNDQEVGEVARHLPAEKIRHLLQDPRTPTERLSLYAFLLAGSGGDRDAALLYDMIRQPTGRTAGALDGLLCGYIHLRPREGWDLLVSILADGRRPFSERFAVARTLRFYHGWKPAETRSQVLRGLTVMVEDGNLADLGLEDLRRWQMWDLTGKVLAQYTRQSHAAPIVRRAIVRYALSCPLPEARTFIDQVRRQDPETVRELEENLAFEKGR